MDIKFTYDTYQDVRRNLFYYSIPTLIIAGFFTFFRVLPPAHQDRILAAIEYITTSPAWKDVLGTGFGLVIFAVLAFLMTEILQVHDQWYDKYVVKWRFRYATDFILPRLIQPFACLTNYRFYEEAEGHIRHFQERLYYPFVGDRDLKIPKNALVRFYEVITVYWLTQLNEIVLFLLGVLILLYRYVGPADLAYRTVLLNDWLAVSCVWILNRLWVHSSRNKVRRATEDEIRAIHEDSTLKAELERRLIEICRDYRIPYGQTTDSNSP